MIERRVCAKRPRGGHVLRWHPVWIEQTTAGAASGVAAAWGPVDTVPDAALPPFAGACLATWRQPAGGPAPGVHRGQPRPAGHRGATRAPSRSISTPSVWYARISGQASTTPSTLISDVLKLYAFLERIDVLPGSVGIGLIPQ
jgi:hypothetical protein